MAPDSGRFRDSAAERFTRPSPTKYQSCRSLQGLPNGIKHIEIKLKEFEIIELKQ
jgi:hypothetical protein